jgi:hypothetical protein
LAHVKNSIEKFGDLTIKKKSKFWQLKNQKTHFLAILILRKNPTS